MQNYTVEELRNILAEAKAEARKAADDFFQNQMGGVDGMACGFAWVSIHGVKGSTKLGRAMKAVGMDKQIWNPSGHMCQNVATKYAGAVAAQNVFRKYGFTAYAMDRLD